MKKRLSTIVMSLLLGLVLLASPVSNAFAQTPATDGVVTLADLGKTEISLRGPYDTSTTTFGLPANWKFTGDAKISLNITTSFNTSFVDGEAAAIGGILTISFNRSTVATLVLNQVGNFTYEVAVPARYLDSARVDGLMELRYTLDSGGSCVADQNMNVIVNPSTSTTFTYEEQQPSTDLSAFPRPIVQS
nr:cellulose biosynthesis cyclic di-GMP-binding regulatory protein BcsB [Anaerolineales bacterium]